MSTDSAIDDYRWLVSAEAAEFLARAAACDAASTLQAAATLRRALSAARTHLVLEQAELRARARRKFAAAERMFFTRVGLEQATDEAIAAYKSARFAADAPVADLCCGIGGDLMALAGRGQGVGVDRAPVAALLARANLQAAADAKSPSVATSDVVVADVATLDMRRFAAWHIDPDRRPAGRRTTRAELHEPTPAVIDSLRAACAEGAVKLAPAAELPATWEREAEREWISRDGECRQLVCWFGALARESAGSRRATIVTRDGSSVRTIVGGDDLGAAPIAPAIGAYLYEPDAAVLAADLTPALAAEHGLSVITPGIAYLTADHVVVDAALDPFRVREILPFDMRRLRELLRARHIGRLEIKKRGVDCEPEKLRRELRLTGDAAAVLVLLPLAGRTSAVLAEREATMQKAEEKMQKSE